MSSAYSRSTSLSPAAISKSLLSSPDKAVSIKISIAKLKRKGGHSERQWHQVTPERLNSLLCYNASPAELSVDQSDATVAASSLRLIRATDKLRSLLCGLNDKLPLDINGLSTISSSFRDTCVFPPLVHRPKFANRKDHKSLSRKRTLEQARGQPGQQQSSTHCLPQYVTINLELSGKWPNELSAFSAMKRLLIIRIHELLSPLGIPSHPTVHDMLDVFLDGLVFRVAISQPFELTLLGQSSSCESASIKVNKTGNSTQNNHLVADTSSEATQRWLRFHRHAPQLTGVLTGLARRNSHVLPHSIRLVKRWLSSHGFPVTLCPDQSELDTISCYANHDEVDANDSRLNELAVELMTVHVSGLLGHTGTASGSPVAVLLRFLRLIGTHDWEKEPLLIDLNEGFEDVAKRQQALESFESDRPQLPAIVLSTPFDPQGAEWTRQGPSRSGLALIGQAANKSRKLLRAMLVAGAKLRDLKVGTELHHFETLLNAWFPLPANVYLSSADLVVEIELLGSNTVFRPSFGNMDFVIKLKHNVCSVVASEALDYTRPQHASKNTIASNQGDEGGKLFELSSILDEDQLPTEIPPPGSSYWPAGYCYNPLEWFITQLKARLGTQFHVYWDRHGGKWVGLRRRLPDTTIDNLQPFTKSALNGLCRHREHVKSARMTVDTTSPLKCLASDLIGWAGQRYIESIDEKSPGGV